MADNLREVIAKMKANQNSQQQTNPVQVKQKPAPAPVKKEVEDDYVDDLDDQENPDEAENEQQMPETEEKTAPVEKKQETDMAKEQAQMQEHAQKIMLLQDNGIFRAEILDQLSQINGALSIIAQVLVDLSGNGKK